MTPEHVIAVAAAIYGYTPELIVSPRKSRRLAQARHTAICACDQLFPMLTVTDLARIFNRDHTTIAYARRTRGVHTKRVHDADVEDLKVEALKRWQPRAPTTSVSPIPLTARKPLFAGFPRVVPRRVVARFTGGGIITRVSAE